MVRAVEFCTEQAHRINTILETQTMRWEEWRQAEPWRTITWSYLGVAAFVAITGVGAEVAGVLLCYKLRWAPAVTWLVVAVSAVYGLLVAVGVRRTMSHWYSTSIGFPRRLSTALRRLRFFRN